MTNADFATLTIEPLGTLGLRITRMDSNYRTLDTLLTPETP